MTKRFYSALLAFALALSLLPWAAIPARAEADEPTIPTPEMPELETCTDKSITLKTVTPPAGCTVEYGISRTWVSTATRWQASPLFTEDPYREAFDADDERFHNFYVRFTAGEETAESDAKSIPLAYIAPNLPTGNRLGCGNLYGSNYNIYDPEKGKLTAMWDKDSKTLTLDDFSGAEGQYVSLWTECTLVLRGENTLDAGETQNSLAIEAEENTVVIRGEGKNPRLTLRGMSIEAGKVCIENCTFDLSWVCDPSGTVTTSGITKYICAYCIRSGCPAVELTDARLLCRTPAQKDAAVPNLLKMGDEHQRFNTSASITLTRSCLRGVPATAESEEACLYGVNFWGSQNTSPMPTLTLTLRDRSALEMNARGHALFAGDGGIAVSADPTSSAVLNGSVNADGDVALGGNITAVVPETIPGNTSLFIGGDTLRITAPGVALTSPEGYSFDAYEPADGVVAYPSFAVHKEEGYGGWFVDENNRELTGTLRFVETPAKTGVKTVEADEDGVRCLVTAPANALLLAASYDAGGRLAGVKAVRIGEACELSEISVPLAVPRGGSCNLMLLNAATFAPLCQPRGGTRAA